jgi:PAS domain S-box-containing protein
MDHMPDKVGIPNEDGFYCLDGSWRFTFVNRITLEFLKRKPEELTGKVIWELFPHLVGSTFERTCLSVMEKHSAQRIEMKSQKADVWYHIVVFPSQGGVAVYWRNITAEKQKQEALAENEERMRLLLESYAQSFWESDAHGIKTTISSAWNNYAGKPSKELQNSDLETLVHPNDLDFALKEYQLAFATGRKIDMVIRIADPERGWRWMNVLAIPRRDESGNIIKWIGMNIDITDRKQFENDLIDSEQRFRALTMATSELLYRMSSDCSELTVLSNSGFFNYTPGPNRNWLQEHIPPEEHTRITDLNRKSIKEKSIFEMEHKVYLADGSVGWVFTRSVPILDENGDIAEWFGVVNNITERIRADENRNYFINMLSHELRNPLAAIAMGLTILKDEPSGSEQAEKTFHIMERQAEQMSRLVDDLLDMTRISQNKIELKKQRIDLNKVVYHIVTDFQPQFSEKGVKLDFALNPDPVMIDADSARLTQAFGNLLHNASKFTKLGDKAKVSVSLDGRETDQAVVTVQDTGTGIEPLFLPRLFEPFTQADSSLAHSLGGLGLGLPIVKGIIDLHNGSIHVQSEGVGKGSQFVIRLPLPNDKGGALKEDQGEMKDAQAFSLRILVIEDIPDLAEIISELLFHLGHEAIVALNGPDGIKKAKNYRPDVVLSDIGLPGMNGYEVAEAFQKDDQLREIYLLALSGYAQPEDVERSRKAGFRNHLAKPVSMEDLKRAITEAYEELQGV